MLDVITPLGNTEPQRDVINGITLIEVAQRSLISVASRKGHEKAVAKRIGKLINADPPAIGHYAGDKNIGAFWIAPDQWMIDAPLADEEDVLGVLAKDFATIASITDQSHGWCRFEITAQDEAQLNRLCGLLCAVDTRRFKKGSATRTVIEHMGCFVLRLSPTEMQIIGARSTAESLHHAITTAMGSSAY